MHTAKLAWFAPILTLIAACGGSNGATEEMTSTTLKLEGDVPTAFIASVYEKALWREPDAEGFAFWTNSFERTGCNASTLGGFVRTVFLTDEFLDGRRGNSFPGSWRVAVESLYRVALDRGGDDEGLQFWMEMLATEQQTWEQVVDSFVATQDFAALAGARCSQR